MIRLASQTDAMSDNRTLTVSPIREQVAEELRVQLARRRISATELARRIGWKQPYIWRRMSGEIAFDVDDLQRIATVLEVDVADLLPPPGSSASRGVTSMYLPGERVIATIGTPGGRSTSSDVVQPRRTKRRKHPTVQKMHMPVSPVAK